MIKEKRDTMDRFNKTKKISIIGIIANIFLLIIKGIIGYISNSKSMIADAFNSAGDILSSFMTYIGNRFSSKEADEDHNLGHGKAEYIYSLLISLTMMILSITVIKDSFIMGIFDNYIINGNKLPLLQFLYVTKDKFLTKSNYNF